MNIALFALNILIRTHQLPSWDILTTNPSQYVEIVSARILNTVQVPRDIGPMTVWYYNLRTVSTSLRLFIPVLISYFCLIIPTGKIKEENMV